MKYVIKCIEQTPTVCDRLVNDTYEAAIKNMTNIHEMLSRYYKNSKYIKVGDLDLLSTRFWLYKYDSSREAFIPYRQYDIYNEN